MNEEFNLEKLSVEELKKLKESLEKNQIEKIKEPNSHLDFGKIDFGLINIDKITKIDDILKEFFNQQQLTNKLLYALLMKEDISPQSITAKMALSKDKYTTDVKQWDNTVVDSKLELIAEKFSGMLSELVLISDSTVAANEVYSLQIIADGKTIWNDSWGNYEIKSPYFSEMTAFDDETYYVLAFQTIPFDESIHISIYEAPNVTFTSIYLKTVRKVY